MSVEFNSSLGQVDVDCLNPKATDENFKMRPYGDEPSGCGWMCRRHPFKTAAVFLGLLCLLLLAGIISLQVHYTNVGDLHDSEMRDIQTKYNNLTDKQNKLQDNYSNLKQDKNLLETKYINLTRERQQLQISYDTLTKLRDDSQTSLTSLRKERDDLRKEKTQLAAEKEELQRRFELVTASRDEIQEELTRVSLNMTEKPCRQGWTKFNGSCYYISTVSKTWAKSKKDCEDRGANLVIIENRKEIDFITRFNDRTWIGLSDTVHEGKWTWVDGTDLQVGAGFWQRGEPNDADDGEDCVELSRSGKGWNDMPCSNKLSWVCEE